MRAKLHRAASRELIEAVLYLEQERAGYGDRFLAAFNVGRNFLLQYPNAGRPTILRTRSWEITGFRYDIVYVILGELISLSPLLITDGVLVTGAPA